MAAENQCSSLLQNHREMTTGDLLTQLDRVAIKIKDQLLVQDAKYLPRKCKGGTCLPTSVVNSILVLAENFQPGIISNRTKEPPTLRMPRWSRRPLEELSLIELHKLLMTEVLDRAKKDLKQNNGGGDSQRGAGKLDPNVITRLMKEVYEDFFGPLPIKLNGSKLRANYFIDPKVELNSEGIFFGIALARTAPGDYPGEVIMIQHTFLMLLNSLEQNNDPHFVAFEPHTVTQPYEGHIQFDQVRYNELKPMYYFMDQGEEVHVMPFRHLLFFDFLSLEPDPDLPGLLEKHKYKKIRGTINLLNGVTIHGANLRIFDKDVSVYTEMLDPYKFDFAEIQSIEIQSVE